MDGTISDIVYHLAGDKLIQINHAFENAEMDWTKVPISKSSMEQMLAELERAHAHVVATLLSLEESRLGDKVRGWGGKSMTALDMFVMLVEHDLYHAGQIRYIRNVAEL
jgi:hypothetical protein